MAKIPFQDVVPPDRRSIRNIPIPNSSSRKKHEINIIKQPEPIQKIEPGVPYNYRAPERESYGYKEEERPKSKRTWIWGLIIILILGFIVSMMTIFASATIVIAPKSEEIAVSMNVKGATEMGTSSIRYEVIKLAQEKMISIKATGEETAEVKANGKIKIYNNFSAEPQRLIVRTRFETKAGLVYRIPESTVVPGKTTAGPGSIEVEIFADDAGEKYNVSKKTTFTIPGFKSEAERYKGFYAEATTDISGGFLGKRKTVNPTDKQTALQSINTELENNLLKDLETKIPDGLALLKNGVIYISRELPQKEDSAGVAVGSEVTAYAILLNQAELSNKIRAEFIGKSPSWEGITAKINDFSLLQITKKPATVESGQKIDLMLGGKVSFRADIDKTLLVERLLGKPKMAAKALIDEFNGISSITSTVRPIWKQSFPTDASKIHIEISP